MRSVLRLVTVTCALTLLIPDAHAEFFTEPWTKRTLQEGEFSFTPEFRYYYWLSNFNDLGQTSQPPNLKRYDRMNLNLEFIWGILSPLTLYGQLSTTRVSLNHPSVEPSNIGLGDQMAGANVRILQLPWGIDLNLQAQIDYATYNNTQARLGSKPYLGDGTTDITGGAFASWDVIATDVKRLSLIGGAGFTWRSSGFSKAIPYTVSFELAKLIRGPMVGVDLTGSWSLQTDTNNPAAWLQYQDVTGSGGSFFVNAVNPQHLSIQARAGYRLNPRSLVKIAFMQTLAGNIAPRGFAASLGFEYRLGALVPEIDPVKHPKEYSAANKGFVMYEAESFSARVIRVNDRLNLIKIDRGAKDQIKVGDTLDIFAVKKDGTIGETVARAKVKSVRENESALNIVEYFREVWIEEGFIAKKPIQ